MYNLFIKPVMDFIFSLVAVIIVFPVIVVLSIIVYLTIGRPVIFSQIRPGKNEKLFKLYKFRTMTDLRDSTGELLSDKERLTGLGKFMRRTSLDELPQLFNVLNGDLSLVGPRPLLVEYLPEYNEEQRKRHNVKPGITGWAQVMGRNTLTWEEKFTLDLYYVENLSFLFDLKILILTISGVLKGSGVYNETGVTMDKFKSTKQ
jgi:lipopolysaccharide/colanic/teichoic acid biosynthesis glycosyltransferase